MKKVILPVLFGILFLLQNGFAKEVCYTGFSGATVYFILDGGKVNEKPFAGRVFVLEPGCNLPAWASITTDESGVDHIGISVSYDPNGGCGNAQAYGTGSARQGFSLTFDNGQDGVIDGTFETEKIKCSDVPAPAKAKTQAHQGFAAQSSKLEK